MKKGDKRITYADRQKIEVITRSNGLCERCKARGIYKPGYIVHHKEYITPGNISNPNITLNLDNLEYVCEDCHNKEHKAVHVGVGKLALFLKKGGEENGNYRKCIKFIPGKVQTPTIEPWRV